MEWRLFLCAVTLLVISRVKGTLVKLPAYTTQFLACCQGQHNECSHIDPEGNVIWVCDCACHPRVLMNHADLGPADRELAVAHA